MEDAAEDSGEIRTWLDGCAGNTGELMARVYDELRATADRLMGDERAEHTLQPTALVHEAFLRLAGSDAPVPTNRAEYLALAAVAMRRILIDHARARGAEKRGGRWKRVTMQGLGEEGPASAGADELDLVQLDEALKTLSALDPRQARIVELRFFGGMTGHEIAEHLGVSRNTVVRELSLSRAWLQRELSRSR